MRILVTGAKGFVGRNLIAELKNRGYEQIYEYDLNVDPVFLDAYTGECDFVFHLAGINRPQDESEFDLGNRGFTCELLEYLKKHKNSCPIVVTSSTQAERNNPYGESKKACEEEVFAHAEATGARVMVYRLPNLFGKWCKPNYNSVTATFCHNIARDLDITINDPNVELTLCYIDDLVDEFFNTLEGRENRDTDFCYVAKTYKVAVGELADKLYSFRKNRDSLVMPSLASEFDRALYGTYISYLPENNFYYKLDKKEDDRGWLAEFIKSESFGQIFVSKTMPGITRGNHWHHSKVEKFLVIQGEAVIRFRRIDSNEVLEYKVDGEKPEVVDIPTGYTHSITNTGESELVTLFWADEPFKPEKPDTYYAVV